LSYCLQPTLPLELGLHLTVCRLIQKTKFGYFPKTNHILLLMKKSLFCLRCTKIKIFLGEKIVFLFLSRILRGPGGERIVDIVPGGTKLELQLTLILLMWRIG
jgi:hypothetical protein